MDFEDAPEEAQFRAEARSWLNDNVSTMRAFEGKPLIERFKLWQKHKYNHGWACLTWPEEYGGHSASMMMQMIWDQEEAKYPTLPLRASLIGPDMAAPTLMAWADAKTKSKLLPRIARADDIWCQLFSEPAGGSDLAALRTRAEKKGNDWIIRGQKIWTSRAHQADYGILLVRTDQNAPKHKGLTYFYVHMKTPGIDVRPIRQISGEANFNEVYFSDARIPDRQRLGDIGQGWQVALTTLMNERASLSIGESGVNFESVFEIAKQVNIGGGQAIENDAVRAKLADWYCQEAGLRFTTYRSMSAISQGSTPGPESSIGKLVRAQKSQDMSAFGIDLLELSGIVRDEASSTLAGLFHDSYLSSPGLRIAGGTDEILANIIAERVLGLPQEPRLDKGVPFRDVPTTA